MPFWKKSPGGPERGGISVQGITGQTRVEGLRAVLDPDQSIVAYYGSGGLPINDLKQALAEQFGGDLVRVNSVADRVEAYRDKKANGG